MELKTILNTTLDGIILDSDVIIELDKEQKLNSILNKLFQENITVYIPKDFSIIDNHKEDLKNKLNEYITSGLLKELSLDTSSKVYKELEKLPFDKGELYVYSLADKHKLLVISNDKIAAYSYLVYKNHNNLHYNELSTDELLENYYAENEKLITRRISNYKFLQLLDYELSDITKITKSNRREQEWFRASEIAEENKKTFKKFSSEENCYLSIGSLAASIEVSVIEKDHKNNIGLKIKSTTNNIQNRLLTRKVPTKESGEQFDYWEYNNIAYNAIIKYLSFRT
ncbi:MAG: hypothetical protein C0627_08675 [Sulfurimonas sp.]|nr:MAG: hypothetical protein C0627_08675 [Sulfurimonas sp.]